MEKDCHDPCLVSSKIFTLLLLFHLTAQGSCADVSVVWTVDGVSQYSLQDPLVVSLGDTLTFVYNGTFSNVWFQTHPQQYEECACNTVGILDADCTSRALLSNCFDLDSNMSIPIVSNDNHYPSFEAEGLYFFVSYSQGLNFFHACSEDTTGGECVSGLKLAVEVRGEDEESTVAVTNNIVETQTSEESTLPTVTAEEEHTTSSLVTEEDEGSTVTTTDKMIETQTPVDQKTLEESTTSVTSEEKDTISSLADTDSTTSLAMTMDINRVTLWAAATFVVSLLVALTSGYL